MLTPSERDSLRLKQIEIAFTASAQAIWSDAQSAYESWAQWEAINDCFSGDAGAELGQHFVKLGLDRAIGATRMAASRDAVLRAYRLSDPIDIPSPSRKLSLCEAAHDLRLPGFRALLTSRAWSEEHMINDDDDVEEFVKVSTAHLDHFCEFIVPNWSVEHPANDEFARLRSAIRASRNELVHGVKSVDKDLPSIDEVRRFLDLTLMFAADLVSAATGKLMRVQTGDATTLEHFKAETLTIARNFWLRSLAQKSNGM